MAKKNDVLPLKLRMRFYAFKYGIYAFIFLMIGLFAFFLNKYMEAVFLFITFVFLRYKFPTTFHHRSVYWCAFWSILSFWLSILTTLPIYLSVLSSVIVGMILCFILYKVQDSINIKNENKKLKEEMVRPKEFSIYSCSKDEFIAHCLKKRIRRDRTEYVWDILRSQIPVNELADKYFVEPQTIKQDRWRYRNKISK